MNVFQEFSSLVSALGREEIRYALVGGVALAFYTEPRFTRDIDILVYSGDFLKVKKIIEDRGYFESISPWKFQKISITLHRFFKAHDDEEMLIDILEGSGNEVERIIASSVVAESEDGSVNVIRKEDLIGLKRIRNSKQDQADIERLKNEED
jgi:hypothetical protein